MISNEEVRLAEWVIKQACKDGSMCHSCEICAHYELCHIQGHDEAPSDWDNPTPPPEPTERPRIEWLRMLPNDDLIDAQTISQCNECTYTHKECISGRNCKTGIRDWWHEVVSLEQFREDVGLP